MSRIGRKPVVLPKGVSLTQKPGQFSVKGPKGELSKPMPSGVTIKVEGDKVRLGIDAPDEHLLQLRPVSFGAAVGVAHG